MRARRYTYAALVGWTIVAALLLLWQFVYHTREMELLARGEARASLRKDILYRSWATDQGGVYVPPTEGTPPNPFLAKTPDRDVVTTSGKRLILIDPAYMTRRVYELGKERFGLVDHITSLRPVNPGNAPDPWERSALAALERGEAEVSSIDSVGGRPYMRLMRSLFTEQRCLKCHDIQGYKVGDVRGGISVSIPMEPFFDLRKNVLLNDFLAVGLLWFVGSVVILIGGRRVEDYIATIEGSEKELKKELAFRRGIVDCAAEGVCVCHGIPVFPYVRASVWNDRMTEMTGYSMEEINRLGWYQSLYPDPDNQARAVARMDRMRKGDDMKGEEWEITRSDGEKRVLAISTSILQAEEGTSHVLALMQDVTDRRRISDALEFVAQWGWTVSPAEYFNALVQFLGKRLGLAHVIVDKLVENGNVAETVAFYSRGNIIPNLRYDLRDTPCENVSGKRLCCYPQGVQATFPLDAMLAEIRAESYIGIPLWDSKGLPIGLIAMIDTKPMGDAEPLAAVLQIVSTRTGSELERIRTEEERNRLQPQLQQAIKMEAVGRLAGGVAHDFNNLLTVIIGNVSMALAKIPPSVPVEDMLSEVNRAAERAARLTQQLLAFSRKQIIEPKVIDLNGLIVDLHTMLVRLIGEDIELKTVPGDGLGKVKADAGQLEQIVLNLAVNARDAMRDGGRLLMETSNAELDEAYCAAHPDASPGRFVLLSVSDTGHGMTEEVAAQIFEPFFTTKPKGSGTGLGLSMAYGAVKQAGGSIAVSSEVGKGTTFRIYLPLAESETGEGDSPDPPPELLDGTETVLLVEDEDVVRKLCVQVLERLGYKVLQASNGAEALAMAQWFGDPIDLLLTDVVMPGMNGNELATQVVILHPETKVLFTSGYTEDAIVHHGVLADGVSFIGKPYTPSSLARKLREVLGRK